jgi:hypothetical protein
MSDEFSMSLAEVRARYVARPHTYAAPLVQALEVEVERLTAAKKEAYEERNRVVAFAAHQALALGHRAGVAPTAIEGWDEAWHGCVYIETPHGQASWHYHDSQAHLFAGLPPYDEGWDGHTTAEKYERLARLRKTLPREETK